MNALNNEQQIGMAPVYNLNARRISPAALLRPNDLLTRTHRRAQMAAVLRDERLQVTASPTGEIQGRLVKFAA